MVACTDTNHHAVTPWMSMIGCAYGITRGSSVACVSGNCADARSPMIVTSACASLISAPRASRPNTNTAGPWPRANAERSMRSGTQ